MHRRAASRRSVGALFSLLLSMGLLGGSEADACRLVELRFTPSADLQIVIWLEDTQGNFVDTIYVTDGIGRYGLGNRPGIMEFNSEWRWPYGRRISTFPVWAHRHGEEYPLVVFQDGEDTDLSHPISQSSTEPFFCRPLEISEGAAWADAGSCATVVWTDKGRFSETETSLYPPRNDMSTFMNDIDHPDLKTYGQTNDLDAISAPTPIGNMEKLIRFSVPSEIPNGDYVAWIEVNKEFDQNDDYDYPSPAVPWSEYGRPYRGQPSLVWKVPFSISAAANKALTTSYEGYGDPDGLTGVLNPPDETITTGVEGSGAGRLLVATAHDGSYQFRVDVKAGDDQVAPSDPRDLAAKELEAHSAVLGFVAPGDDGMGGGKVTLYEIRYLPGVEITEENFLSSGIALEDPVEPVDPGVEQNFTIPDLIPKTQYWVGVRALDDCLNPSGLTVFTFATPRAESPAVSGCRIAVGRVAAGGTLAVLALAGVVLLVVARRRRRG